MTLTVSTTLTVYDQHGNPDQMPVEFPVEEPLETLETNRYGVLLNVQGVLDAVALRNSMATLTKPRISFYAEGGYHYIFFVKTKSGESYIARISRVNLTEWSQNWINAKMRGEQAILEYLKKVVPTIPVPIVYEISSILAQTNGSSFQLPFLLMEKAKEVELTTIYSCLNMSQKVALTRNMARVMGDIFNVTSSVFGSAVGTDDNGNLLIGPPVDSGRRTCPMLSAKPYSVHELATFRIKHLRDICPANASEALNALETVSQRICSTDIPSSYRLFHPDLRMQNIFVQGDEDDIKVTSVIDWDLHTFLPVPLAADYPMWLRFDGFYNPRYNPRGGQTEFWWEEDFSTILKLREEFREAIRESHADFYNQLSIGTAQRELFYWFCCWEENKAYFDAVVAWSKKYL